MAIYIYVYILIYSVVSHCKAVVENVFSKSERKFSDSDFGEIEDEV
jgi:hypothetical protein